MASEFANTVAIVGASRRRHKYGNRAVRAYRSAGWRVYPVHPTAAEIEGLRAYRRVSDVPSPLKRVSVYLHPETVLTVLEDIAAARPLELFLNPGSESASVIASARQVGLEPILDCSIVAVGRDPDRPEEP